MAGELLLAQMEPVGESLRVRSLGKLNAMAKSPPDRAIERGTRFYSPPTSFHRNDKASAVSSMD